MLRISLSWTPRYVLLSLTTLSTGSYERSWGVRLWHSALFLVLLHLIYCVPIQRPSLVLSSRTDFYFFIRCRLAIAIKGGYRCHMSQFAHLLRWQPGWRDKCTSGLGLSLLWDTDTYHPRLGFCGISITGAFLSPSFLLMMNNIVITFVLPNWR